MNRRTSLLASLPLLAACVNQDPGYVNVFVDPSQSSVGFEVKGDDLVMEIDASMFLDAYGEGVVHIDSAAVVAQVDGQEITYDDPDVVTEDFPVAGTSSFELVTASFSVPSPIDDTDKFESSCLANGRSVTLTVRFYATQYDRTGAETPPLITSTVAMPLVNPKDPPPAEVFGSPALLSITTQGPPTVAPPRVSRGVGDDVLVTIEDGPGNPETFSPGSYRVWRADPDSVQQIHYSFSDFFEMPRASASLTGGTVLGARSAYDPYALSLIGLDENDEPRSLSEIRIVADQPSPEYEALRLSYLAPSPNGSYVVVQSAYSLEGPQGAVPPVDGKYYGSFLFEVAEDLVILSATSLDRDLLFIESTADGGTLLATSTLPPREEGTTLVVERLDPAGGTLFSYEEDTLVYEVVVRPTEDGGAIAAFEDQTTGGTIEVIRIGADGSLVYRYTAVGTAPSLAVNADGLAVISFIGTVPGFDLPTRSVPLLVELSDEGIPVRAAQVACGGFGIVGNDSTDGAMLVGAFQERVTIGDTTAEVGLGQISVSAVE